MKNNLITKLIAWPLVVAGLTFGSECVALDQEFSIKSSVKPLKKITMIVKNKHCVDVVANYGEFNVKEKICDYYDYFYNSNLHDVKKINAPYIELYNPGFNKGYFEIKIKDLDMFNKR